MGKRWLVKLSLDERNLLEHIIKKGHVPGYKIKLTHMLLKADEGENGPSWSDARIATEHNVSESMVRNLRKRFVEKGLTVTLQRKKRINYTMKLGLNAKDKLIDIASSQPPEGYSQWSVRLLANRLVELEIVDEISHMTVQRVMKKHLNRG